MTINNQNQQKDNHNVTNLTKTNWNLQLSPISVTLIPYQQEENIINSTITNYTDIIKYKLELQEANNKLKESELFKRDVVQNMVHGLKIPCNGIFSLVTALYEIEDHPEKKDYLASVVSCAEELLNYYNNILSYLQNNSGLPPIVLNKFDPKQLVNKIIDKAMPIAQRKGLNLSCNFQYDLTNAIISDTYRIGAILEQLIDNSINFTKAGKVVVTVNMFAISPALSESEQQNREMVFQFMVHDSGIGLSKEIRQHLHEKIDKFDVATQYHGLGSGLSFVKRLIGELNGEIEVTSEKGKSTTIVCNIPVKLPLLDDLIYDT
ncbi:sensor histidine kinase [Rickettsia endosymbiont of Orchestes rusci]|uniref:sensor histidine kinase n=1 Tax=Rickettsia endosymbiont of Orchestes rusci TaxID=3066250 RepID=UPI00313CAF5F